MINYGLFFSYGDVVLRLPINPEELPVSKDSDNSEYNVLGLGAITVPRRPKQKEVEISSYFPARVTSAVLTPNQFREPEFYIQFFQKAMDDRRVITYTPVRYMEDGTPYFTSDPGFKCTVQSFSFTEKGGETGDFYYTLTIREWRDYSPKRVIARATSPSSGASEDVVTETPNRQTGGDQIVVGTIVIANGPNYYTSYGDNPHGTLSGRRCKVTRIVSETRAYPYHVATEAGAALGWMKRSALTVVSNV